MRGGERDDEFATFAHARWPTFVRAGIFLGCDPHEAQDLAQVTLARCWDRWDRVRRAADRDAYVYRVLLNCLRDSKRRRWWGERPTDFTIHSHAAHRQVAADGFESLELTDSVRRALDALSDDHRRVVLLRYFVGLDEATTATVLGIPVGTVKSRHARALAALSASEHLVDEPEQKGTR